MTLPHLNSLWVGPRLDYLERLCLASARATGHEFTLWSYEPHELEGVPPGTDLRDAAEVMPRERLLRYRDSGSVALGANLWRIEMLAKGLGHWVDMDFIFLRPLAFPTPFVFGWEYENHINNAVLGAPANSAMVRDLQSIPQPNRCPPFYGPKRKLMFYWQRLREGRIELEDYPWGTFSAGLVTYVVKTNNLAHHAQPPDVFYPVRWKDARELYEPAEVVEGMLTERTVAVHMWHSRLEGLKDAPPPPGSFIAKMCDRFGVEAG
ncbi:hypothetical protein [Tsuneonella amylolytica]|uniref:hypothetical protein n=1 Tax=Tsuneonella amylolytica TaxID=2338327 RepID=UPI000EA9412F|nr:hypothetical protein [Tsuneonella amylolytica]